MNSQKKEMNKFWTKFFPYLFIISMISGMYLAGIKFVQLGLPDYGENVIGISDSAVNIAMIFFAFTTCISGILVGFWMNKYNLSLKKRIRLIIINGIIFGIVLLNIDLISTDIQFIIYMIFLGLSAGGVFTMVFSLVFILIPSRNRGYVAGVMAGTTYLISNISPIPWDFQGTTIESTLAMIPAGIFFLLLILKKNLIKNLELTEKKENEYNGRFIGHSIGLGLILTFGVFFIDSFGFLRVISEETIYNATWWAGDAMAILFGITHFISAILAGIIYKKYDEKVIFILTFIGFITCDLLFSLYPDGILVIIVAMLYCSTVSCYTINIIAFASDLSTKENISKNTGLFAGIGLWLSSFCATSLSPELAKVLPGVDGFKTHLFIVSMMAIPFLLLSLYYKSKK